MAAPKDTNDSTPPVPVPAVLDYESAGELEAGPRPRWVYAVFCVYGLGILGLLSAPVWWSSFVNEDVFLQTSVCVGCLFACGACLMILPVRVARRRPITRRSIWVPIIGSAFLAGSLGFGAVIATCEYLRAAGNPVNVSIVIGTSGVWAAWALVFVYMAFSTGPQSIGMKLHRALISGSVMELLIAVPTHIVVRRRPECCAGIMTGMAICIGVLVMFASFGPSVLLLFYRRRKQISNK